MRARHIIAVVEGVAIYYKGRATGTSLDDVYVLVSLPGRKFETETPFDEMFSLTHSRTTGSRRHGRRLSIDVVPSTYSVATRHESLGRSTDRAR